MGSTLIREQLATRSTTGRYTAFVAGGLVLSLVGLLLFVLAARGDSQARAWQLFHVNWLFFTSVSAGSVAFVAVHKITKAKWSGLVIRFAEAAAAFLPISFLGFLLIFLVGYEQIYPDMHGLFHAKERWLSHGWMFWRLFVGLAVLYVLGFLLVRANLVPDMHEAKAQLTDGRRRLYDTWTSRYDATPAGRARHDDRVYRLAPAYIVTYAIVMTMVAFDMIMALQPHWFSNLLGGFFFMGAFLSAHTALALLMLVGERELGIASLISPKQRHDLGKLAFGFTVFWAYLMWSQFLVIWYGNLPEETGFVFARLWGPWLPVGKAVFIGMFLVPFWGLLFVATKKNRTTLALFSAISLLSLWLERYLLVLPSVTPLHGPVVGLPEIAPTLLLLGLFLLSYGGFARTFPMISPRMAQITLDRERGHAHADIGGEFDHDETPRDYVPTEAMERRHEQR